MYGVGERELKKKREREGEGASLGPCVYVYIYTYVHVCVCNSPEGALALLPVGALLVLAHEGGVVQLRVYTFCMA